MTATVVVVTIRKRKKEIERYMVLYRAGSGLAVAPPCRHEPSHYGFGAPPYLGRLPRGCLPARWCCSSTDVPRSHGDFVRVSCENKTDFNCPGLWEGPEIRAECSRVKTSVFARALFVPMLAVSTVEVAGQSSVPACRGQFAAKPPDRKSLPLLQGWSRPNGAWNPPMRGTGG